MAIRGRGDFFWIRACPSRFELYNRGIMTTRKKFDRNRTLAEYRAMIRDAWIAIILTAIALIVMHVTGPHS